MTRFRRVRVLAAALLCAPGSLLVSQQNASADAMPAEVHHLVERYGISVEQAAFQLALEPSVGALQSQVQARWGDTFAGLWMDHGAGGLVTVAFAGPTKGRLVELVPMFPDPSRLRVVSVTRTHRDLEALLGRVVADRAAPYDAWVDVRRNAVVVSVDTMTPGLAEAFRARYGEGVVVEANGTSGPNPCTARTNCTPLRSGVWIDVPGGFFCSAAFAVKRKDTGAAGLLSAGHCGDSDVNAVRSHNSVQYGTVTADQFSGQVDVERHSVDQNSHTTQASIMVGTSETARPVRSRGAYDDLAIGQTVCKAGATTNETCGPITSLNVSPGYVPGGTRFIQADYCSLGGDSGSGVYRTNTAIGVHSGGLLATSCTTGHFSFFSHIEYGGTQMNSTVVTQLDGLRDLLVFESTNSGSWVKIKNNGNNSFSWHGYAIRNRTLPTHVLTVDYNADGHDDLLAFQPVNRAWARLRNVGDSTFVYDNYAITNRNTPTHAVTLDYNNDGRQDILSFEGGSWVRLKNNGNSTFTADGVAISGLGTPSHVVKFDYSNDGRLDLMVFEPFSQGSWVRLKNNGSGTLLHDGFAIRGLGTPSHATAVDFSSDFKPDILVFEPFSLGSWVRLRNSGNGTGTLLHEGFAIRNQATPASVVNVDYNIDSRVDLLVFEPANLSSWVKLKNNGTGLFTNEGRAVSGLATPNFATVLDWGG